MNRKRAKRSSTSRAAKNLGTETSPLNNDIIITSWVWPDLLFAKTEAILATKDYFYASVRMRKRGIR